MTFPAEASTQASFSNTGQNPLYNNPTPETPTRGTTSAFQPFVRQPRPINQMSWQPFLGQTQQYPSHYGNPTPPLGANFPFQPTFYQNPPPLPTWPVPGQIQQNTLNYENSALAFRANDAFSSVFTPPYSNTMAPYSAMSWQDPMQYFHVGQTPHHAYAYANPAPSHDPITEPAVPKPTIANPEKTNKRKAKIPYGKQIQWTAEQDKTLMDALKPTHPNSDERKLALVNVCKTLNISGTNCKKRFKELCREEGLSDDEKKVVSLKTTLLNEKVFCNEKTVPKNVLSNKEIAKELNITEELLREKWKKIKEQELDFYPNKNTAWRHSDVRKLYKLLEKNPVITLEIFNELAKKIESVSEDKIISKINELNKSRDSSEKIVIDQEVIDRYSDKRRNHNRVYSKNKWLISKSPKSKYPRKINEDGDCEILKVLGENEVITLEIFNKLAEKIIGPGNRVIYNRIRALNKKIGKAISKDVDALYKDRRAERRRNDPTIPHIRPRWTKAQKAISMRPQPQEQSNQEYIEETSKLIGKDFKACSDRFYNSRKKEVWSQEEDAKLMAVLDPATLSPAERDTALYKLSQELGTIGKTCLQRYKELCNLKQQHRNAARNETSVANEPETTTSTTSASQMLID